MKKPLLVLFALLMAAASLHAATRRRASLPPGLQPEQGCTPRTLAENAFSYGIEVDETYVYYADDFGSVFRVPKNGGLPQTIASIAPDFAGLMRVDETTLYIMISNEFGDMGSIVAIPKGGGEPLVIVDLINNPFSMNIDATSIYWTSIGTVVNDTFLADGSVGKVDKDGTHQVNLATGLNAPSAVASDGTNVFFTESGFSPFNNHAGLRSVPKGGGSVRSLVTGPVTMLMLKDNDIYYELADFITGGDLRRIAKSGGNSTSLTKGLDFVTKMIAGGDKLYYFNTGDNDTIEWVPLAGGARTTLQNGQFLTTEFALDDCGAYFIDGDLNVRLTPR